jgi:two-component system CheB/CheR fusion protein
MNNELRQRGEELNQVNGFLESILRSMRGAVVVVDPELKVLVWNQGAEELWGVREDEARGKHLLGLDIGLPVDQLKAPMRACLSGSKEHVSLTAKAVNRRGKSILCHVTVTPLRNRTMTVRGVILITEEILKTTSKNGAKTRGAKEAAAKSK